MLKKVKHHWFEFNTVRQHNNSTYSLSFIGAPDDRGVLNVGGRLGAGGGPDAILKMFSNFMLGSEGELEKLTLSSGYSINLGESIEVGHGAMRKSVSDHLSESIFPIVLGGGHDYGYPHLAGVSDHFGVKNTALINIDAHLDLRPPDHRGISSGSPFYLALENKVIHPKNLYEFGIQTHCNQQAHLDYAKKMGVRYLFLEECRKKGGVVSRFQKILNTLIRKKFNIVISVDIDAFQMAYAPGVSAPQSDGFTPQELFAILSLCGKSSNVKSIGFFEYAPILDQDLKTARLVATCIHRFLSGFSLRSEPKVRRTKKSSS